MAKTSRSLTLTEQLMRHPADRIERFRALSIPEQSSVLVEFSPHTQQTTLEQLKTIEIVNILDNLDMHQARKVLAHLPDTKKRERIIKRLTGEAREKLEYFLRFHPKASLSIINFNYLFLSATLTIAAAAEIIDNYYDETGRFPELLVHEQGKLIGVVPLSRLVRERNTAQLQKFVQPIPTITYQAEVNQIIDVLVSENSQKVAVLDHDESVLGVVYADSARTLFGKMPAASLYDVAGVDDSERPFDSVGHKVQMRYKWLVLNLATTFLAGSVVLLFQDTLDTLTFLSVYMPVLAGMSGNAAAQSFAIMVRGVTLGTISLETAWPAIWREVWAGFFNGVIVGSIVALISFVWQGSLMAGLVVALALIGSHMVAGFAGAIVPLIMKHLGKDPAATSTIFISTVTDVMSFVLLFGLATWLLL